MASGYKPKGLSVGFRVKSSVVNTSLLALATAFEIVSRHSEELKAELADWEEGRVFSIGILPDGPTIAMKKEGGVISYLGKGHHDSKLRVLFKNLDSALLPFLGQMGSHTAFAQHRAILHGSVGEGMQASRAMNIVQKYLMPGIILDRTFKNPPKFTSSDLALKARVMSTLLIGLVKNSLK